MTVNEELRRASQRVKSEVKEMPVPLPPSKAAGRVPLALGIGLISVLTIVAVVWLIPFGRGPGPALENPAMDDVAMVRDWVEGALAGRFDEIASLTYGESGEPEAMAQLALTLHGYQAQYGEPQVSIAPFETDGGEFAFTCMTVDFGDFNVSGGIVVREWPDLGRKLWEFRSAMAGCATDSDVTTTLPELAGG